MYLSLKVVVRILHGAFAILLLPLPSSSELITFSAKSYTAAEDSTQSPGDKPAMTSSIEAFQITDSINTVAGIDSKLFYASFEKIEIIEIHDPSWARNHVSETDAFQIKQPDSYNDFFGLKFRTPSKNNRTKDIAQGSKYSDTYNAPLHLSNYHTFKVSADFLTPPLYDISIQTTLMPALWVEKGKQNPIESDRDVSLSYKLLLNYSKNRITLGSGVSGIVFARDKNIIGNEHNYMNCDIKAGIRVIQFTYMSFLMRYPVTSELEKIAEPNYTVLIIREL